jgi:hypothetical protein
MGRHNQSGKRFRARAARRPLRFWWQPFALLGVTVLPLVASAGQCRSV